MKKPLLLLIRVCSQGGRRQSENVFFHCTINHCCADINSPSPEDNQLSFNRMRTFADGVPVGTSYNEEDLFGICLHVNESEPVHVSCFPFLLCFPSQLRLSVRLHCLYANWQHSLVSQSRVKKTPSRPKILLKFRQLLICFEDV